MFTSALTLSLGLAALALEVAGFWLLLDLEVLTRIFLAEGQLSAVADHFEHDASLIM